MSDLWASYGVPVLIAFSDLHLRHNAPAWRSPEPDWYEAMGRFFNELRELAFSIMGGPYCVQIAIAGDVFDKWDVPPALLHFAVRKLREMKAYSHCTPLAVPGQHDLPNHSHDQVHRSAYGVLKECQVIDDIHEKSHFLLNDFHIRGAGWNSEPETIPGYAEIDILLLHHYVWMDGCSYKGAPKTSKCGALRKAYKKPNLIVAGDNHTGFWHQKTRVFNCGTVFRHTSEHLNYRPRILIVTAKGNIVPYYLDTSKDVYLTEENILTGLDNAVDTSEFLEELASLGRGGLNYLDAVRRYCDTQEVVKEVRLLVNQILEKTHVASAKSTTKPAGRRDSTKDPAR